MLKIIGNIAAGVGVALVSLTGVPVWVMYAGLGCKAVADLLRAISDHQAASAK